MDTSLFFQQRAHKASAGARMGHLMTKAGVWTI